MKESNPDLPVISLDSFHPVFLTLDPWSSASQILEVQGPAGRGFLRLVGSLSWERSSPALAHDRTKHAFKSSSKREVGGLALWEKPVND